MTPEVADEIRNVGSWLHRHIFGPTVDMLEFLQSVYERGRSWNRKQRQEAEDRAHYNAFFCLELSDRLERILEEERLSSDEKRLLQAAVHHLDAAGMRFEDLTVQKIREYDHPKKHRYLVPGSSLPRKIAGKTVHAKFMMEFPLKGAHPPYGEAFFIFLMKVALSTTLYAFEELFHARTKGVYSGFITIELDEEATMQFLHDGGKKLEYMEQANTMADNKTSVVRLIGTHGAPVYSAFPSSDVTAFKPMGRRPKSSIRHDVTTDFRHLVSSGELPEWAYHALTSDDSEAILAEYDTGSWSTWNKIYKEVRKQSYETQSPIAILGEDSSVVHVVYPRDSKTSPKSKKIIDGVQSAYVSAHKELPDIVRERRQYAAPSTGTEYRTNPHSEYEVLRRSWDMLA